MYDLCSSYVTLMVENTQLKVQFQEHLFIQIETINTTVYFSNDVFGG